MADARIPEIITDLQDQTAALLRRELGLTKTAAANLGVKVAQCVIENWSGQIIYIPKNYFGGLSERDSRIFAEFNGKNHAALAKKYKLTTQQVYRIIRIVSERMRQKDQARLFD